jgi:uncharacterized protein YuzE
MALTRPRYSNIVDTDYKASCRIVTTTNITLSGGAPGTYDSITLVAGDRILVAGQSTASQNGIYVVQTVGTGSNGTWIRSFDANTSDRVTAGMTTAIEEGTYVGKTWRLTTGNPIVLGTTDLTFVDSSAGGASVGGANRTVQYNENGSFGGAANFLYWGANGNVTIGSTTAATTANTGALLVKGGISVAGNIVPAANILYSLGSDSLRFKDLFLAGNSIFIGSETISVHNGTFAFTSNGGAQTGNVFLGNVATSGKLVISDTTDAVPYVMGSGAFHVAGGMSIGKDFWVGGNLYVANVVSQSTTILEVNEPLVYLDANNFPYNYDIGVFSDFTGGSANAYQYTGAVRSYQTNEWVFFSNLRTAPGAGIVSITSSDVLYDPIKAGNIVAANTTPSTSTTTGALIVAGGAGIAGNVYTNAVRTATGVYWAGNNNPIAGITFTSGSTAPVGANKGDKWYDTDTDILYEYIPDGDSNQWVDVSSPDTQTNFTASPTAPTSPILGDSWYDTDTDILFLRINDGSSNVWVDIGSASANIPNALVSNTITVQQTITVNSGNVATAIINAGTSGFGNIGATGAAFNTIFARASSALYADLAEKYQSDRDYEPGTVVVFGGYSEITTTTVDHDTRVAGVISTQPAYIMNDSIDGLAVALTGRVPCRVLGPVAKGDLLVTSNMAGTAQRCANERYSPGCILGKSLENIMNNEVKTIEIAVGRF